MQVAKDPIRKPRLFVGSSTEGLEIAEAIQANLDRFANVTIWTQDIFALSTSALDSLVRVLGKSDYGVFVFNSDDVARIRGARKHVTRDNVVFELGLFVGRLGKERCFIVAPRGDKRLHMPTDLLGMIPTTFEPSHVSENSAAALGVACRAIKKSIMASPQFKDFQVGSEIERFAAEWHNALADVNPARQKGIAGIWRGLATPRESGPPFTPQKVKSIKPFELTFRFQVAGKVVHAQSSFRSPSPERGLVRNNYVGGFHDAHILKLEYRKQDAKEIGYGTTMLKLSADSMRLEGRVFGYSSHVEELFCTDVDLHKHPRSQKRPKRTRKSRATSRD